MNDTGCRIRINLDYGLLLGDDTGMVVCFSNYGPDHGRAFVERLMPKIINAIEKVAASVVVLVKSDV